MVARPAEQVLSQIAGIEHTILVARPGLAVLTVQFKVGVPRTEALVRLYDVLNANQDWLPRDLGVADPIVKPRASTTCRCWPSRCGAKRQPAATSSSAWRTRGNRTQGGARHARGADHRRSWPRGARLARPAACASAASTCCGLRNAGSRQTACPQAAPDPGGKTPQMLTVRPASSCANADRSALVVGVTPANQSTCARWRKIEAGPELRSGMVWPPAAANVAAPRRARRGDRGRPGVSRR